MLVQNKVTKHIGGNTSNTKAYLGAFWNHQPVSWYDKSQLIAMDRFTRKYKLKDIRYIGQLRPDTLSSWLDNVRLDADSSNLVYIDYIYSDMGSGYMNPTYSFQYPLTEYIQQHNKLCRDYLQDLLKYLDEVKPRTYLCLVYIPTDIDTLEIPAGNILRVPYGNPDMPGIYVSAKQDDQMGSTTQTIDRTILDTIFEYYYSGSSTPAIDTDRYLGSQINYNIAFKRKYRQFTRLRLDKALFLEQVKLEQAHLVPFSRILSMTDRRLPYRYFKEGPKLCKAVHWGQRKLFLSELEFLTLHGHLSNTILYVGAAEGTHIIYLSQLFPDHKFILYDPRDFAEGLRSRPNVVIHQQFFTDEDVEEYKNTNLLFLCDIRSQTDTIDSYDAKFEVLIQENMMQQMNWHLEMSPAMSMLKFRLGYMSGLTKYLKGELRYQVWSPACSNELRLITVSKEHEYYDNSLIEEIMFRFRLTRQQRFDGLSYDDKAEHVILEEYIRSKGHDDIPSQINKMKLELDEALGKTLEDKKKQMLGIYKSFK